ncbi:MAG: MBL fold metallo-hydrolase [Propionibacteriaceae bacterium]|jgi:glyoxylase-like metal-dependent hydrolase (beta-lactamase superfamily II)|nr:MBL fold metallo-hydrolase [Propionibacteriaceae bacterium]
MLLVSIQTALWGENCWLLASGEGGQAVVVDPGLGATESIAGLLREHKLTLKAVLASHGHLDHVADAAAVADRWGVPVYIHPADRELLSDPAKGLDAGSARLVAQVLDGAMAEPAQVREIGDREVLDLAGFAVTVLHAPGHRPGCVMFRVPTDQGVLVFTGDVLFAGSIGRTDLPGGSMRDMVASLRDVVLGRDPATGGLNLPDGAVVLPGHGPHARMADERASNPYLQRDFLENHA